MGVGVAAPAVPAAFDLNNAAEIQDLAPAALGTLEAARAPNLVLGQPAEEEEAPPPVLTASPRRSPRIRRAYDGVRVGSVERAAKRKAVATGSDSSLGSSRRSGSSWRRKKVKTVAVSELLELPLLNTPSPLTRGKLKQIAQCCDLNANAILEQAKDRAVSVSSGDASNSASASTGSPACVFNSFNG